MRVFGVLRFAFVALFAAAAASACTVVTGTLGDRDGLQCTTDAECVTLVGAGGRCFSTGTCGKVTATPPPGIGSGCSTNSECSDRLGTISRCVAAKCLPAIEASSGCFAVVGDAVNDSALLFGVMIPSQGTALDLLASMQTTMIAATDTWNESLPTGNKIRPTAAVLCAEGKSPSATAKHLQDLGVSAIIGPLGADKFDVVTQAAASSGIPVFGPNRDDIALASRTAAPGEVAIGTVANRADAVSPFGNAAKALATSLGPNLRYAYVSASSASSAAFKTAVLGSLALNGTKAADDPLFSAFTYDADPNGSSFAPALIASQVARATPRLILIPEDLFVASIVDQIETRWTATPRPTYLLLKRTQTVEGVAFNYNFDGRVFTVETTPDAATLSNLDVRALKLAKKPGDFSSAYYDAFMVAGISLHGGASKANKQPSEVRFNDAILALRDMVDGDTISLDSAGLKTALALVNGGSTKMKLTGASGPFLLDKNTNVARTTAWQLSCIGSSASALPKRFNFAGVTFDAAGAASGAIKCP